MFLSTVMVNCRPFEGPVLAGMLALRAKPLYSDNINAAMSSAACLPLQEHTAPLHTVQSSLAWLLSLLHASSLASEQGEMWRKDRLHLQISSSGEFSLLDQRCCVVMTTSCCCTFITLHPPHLWIFLCLYIFNVGLLSLCRINQTRAKVMMSDEGEARARGYCLQHLQTKGQYLPSLLFRFIFLQLCSICLLSVVFVLIFSPTSLEMYY